MWVQNGSPNRKFNLVVMVGSITKVSAQKGPHHHYWVKACSYLSHLCVILPPLHNSSLFSLSSSGGGVHQSCPGWEGYTPSWPGWGVPQPYLGCRGTLVLAGGYPIWAWPGGTPVLSWPGGTPVLGYPQPRLGYPQSGLGYPSQPGLGYPPDKTVVPHTPLSKDLGPVT